MQNNKLMKKILTTASTLAVLSSGASAFAAVVETTATNASLLTGTNLSTNAAWVDADSLKITGDDKVLFDKDGAKVGSIDVADTVAANNAAVVSKDTTIGNVVDLGNGGNTMAINVNGANLTLNAADLTALTGVALADANSKLTFSGAGTLALATVGAGTLDQSSGTITKVDVTTGTANISGGTAALVNITDAGKINVSGGNVTKFDLANAGAVATITGGTTTTADVKTGTLNMSAGNVTTANITTGTANISGGTAALVNITDTGSVNLSKTAVATAVNLNHANSSVNLSGGTLTEVDANTADFGAVNVSGNATLGKAGATNAIKVLNFDSNSELTLGANTSSFKTLKAATGGTIKFAADSEFKFTGTEGNGSEVVMDFANVGGKIEFSGAEYKNKINISTGSTVGELTIKENATVAASLGGSGVLALVKVSDAKTVDFKDSLATVKKVSLLGATSNVKISKTRAEGTDIDAAAANHTGTVTLENTEKLLISRLGETNDLGKLVIAGSDVEVKSDNAANVGSVHFAKGHKDAKFTTKVLDGITFTTEESGGTVEFTAASKLADNVGAADKSLKALHLKGTAVVELDVDHKNVFADITAETKDTLELVNLGDAADKTYFGIGTNDQRAKSLSIAGAGKSTFKGEVFTKDATIAASTKSLFEKDFTSETFTATDGNASTTVLTFNEKFNSETATFGRGTYEIKGAATIKTATFKGNSAVTFGSGLTGSTKIVGKETVIDAEHTLEANSSLFFTTGDVTNVNFKGAADGNGTLDFQGDHKITGALGANGNALASVTLAATDKKVEYAGDLYSTNVKFAGGEAVLYKGDKGTSIKGAAELKGTLKVGTTEFAIDTNSTVVENSTLDVVYDAKTDKIGGLNLGANNLVFTAGKELTVNVSGLALESTEKDVVTFTGAGTSANLKVNGSNLYIAWEKSDKSAANVMKVVGKPTEAKFKTQLAEDGLSASSADLAVAIAKSIKSLSEEQVKFAIDLTSADLDTRKNGTTEVKKLTAKTDTASVSVNGAVAVAEVSTSRISSVMPAGVASGDEDDSKNFGVWTSGFMNKATQKARKGNVGFKTDLTGGTIGADTMISDNTVLGLAATYAQSKTKFKNELSGSKAKNGSVYLNVYSRHDLGNNWFVQGVAGFGQGEVKLTNTGRATTDGKFDGTSTAKYDTMSISLEALAGYNMAVADCVAFVPTAGLRYTNVNEGGYTEKGALFNRTVTKKSADRLTGVLAGKLQASYDMSGTTVMPSVHAFVNHDFKAKNAKSTATISGVADSVNISGGKASKTAYGAGLDLSAKSDMFTYGVGYEAKLSNKFVSHQGTLNLRVDL
jgi:outer membrane autotransporter protein